MKIKKVLIGLSLVLLGLGLASCGKKLVANAGSILSRVFTRFIRWSKKSRET